ncbi:MAG: trehalose-6-phosphate synthase [Gammaproteobacteria bacterium]|nr:trehalose-6-phosphate synthase [Gammaproteobacteria bacterium]
MNRLVVVSNRVPVPSDVRTLRGGLAVAVYAALESRGGLWFGWNGQVVESTARHARVVKEGKVGFATLPLARADYEDFYKGYSNRVLWPLFHERLNLVEYRRRYEEGYARVNRLFARKLLPLLEADDLVWVHDYHLVPLAQCLRQAGCSQALGFFLHIPFPPYDVFRVLPHYERMLGDLLAYDLLGFQSDVDLHAFLDTVRQTLPEARVNAGTVSFAGRRVRVGAFPISIDVDDAVAKARTGRNSALARRLRESLQGRRLIVGVDRLDYSKGLPQRFLAYETMLETYPANVGKVVLMQIAQPSRGDVPEYQEIRRALEAASGRINGRFADYDWQPLRYINSSYGRSSILGFLALSRVGLLTPLRDGMNLVAKEFVASQDADDPGVLVLSYLTGAARELDAALLVNPYDIEGLADVLARAVAMPLAERRERWQAMFDVIRRNDINAWRQRFLAVLESGR